MGLDMYLYKVRTPKQEVIDILNKGVMSLETKYMLEEKYGVTFADVEDASKLENEIGVPCQIENITVNLERFLKEKYNITNFSFGGSCYDEHGETLYIRDKDTDTKHNILMSDTDIKKYRNTEPIDVLCYCQEQVMYWRKANQIRGWIVENTKYEGDWDCIMFKLGRTKLKKLRNDCLAVIADPSKAKELLPTTSKFFFGSDDYDSWYYQGLRDTVNCIDKILGSTDWETEKIAYYEWW